MPEDNLTRPNIPDLISQMLLQNQDKNFVQRIMKPDLYPNLDMGNGFFGTHLMSSGQMGNDGIAFPNIVQLPTGEMQRLEPRAAFEYAIKNNEYIPFKSPEEAEWFAQNYKSVWGK
jgi:hypothetical protein